MTESPAPPHPLREAFVGVHDAARGGNEALIDLNLRLSERTVGQLCRPLTEVIPEPTDEDLADYLSRRRDATLAVARYAWDTSLYLSSKGGPLGNLGYQTSDPQVIRWAAQSLGDYAKDDLVTEEPSGPTTAYIERAGF